MSEAGPPASDPCVVSTVADLRTQVAAWRSAGLTVALVPTMGALHEGHMSLIRLGAAQADRVVTSIFVNPTQFGPNEDFARYPRQLEQDRAKVGAAGGHLVYAPTVEEMYPGGFATTISVTGVSAGLCGAARPGHFDGVATVVTLLFNMTQPDYAFFGEKDWQQLQLVRRLVADLKLPLEIVGCPCIRAADGLALSSRNQRLSGAARAQAAALPGALFDAARRIEAGEAVGQVLAGAETALAAAGIGPVEYLALRDAETLAEARPGRPARLLVAAWLDGVRLIDNVAVALPG
jgi:pantoate--beta-alanine ligase